MHKRIDTSAPQPLLHVLASPCPAGLLMLSLATTAASPQEFVPLRLPPHPPRGRSHSASTTLIHSPTAKRKCSGSSPEAAAALGPASKGRGAAKREASQHIRRAVGPDALLSPGLGANSLGGTTTSRPPSRPALSGRPPRPIAKQQRPMGNGGSRQGSGDQQRPMGSGGSRQGSGDQQRSEPAAAAGAACIIPSSIKPEHSPGLTGLDHREDQQQPVGSGGSRQGSGDPTSRLQSMRPSDHPSTSYRPPEGREGNRGSPQDGSQVGPQDGPQARTGRESAAGSRSVTDADARAGLIVVRGRDWCWGDQDGGSGHQGTLVGPSNVTGYWTVRWTNGYIDVYRVGAGGCFDLDRPASSS